MTYVLVLTLILMPTEQMVITTVPGYKSQDACEKARIQWLARDVAHRGADCIEGPQE